MNWLSVRAALVAALLGLSGSPVSARVDAGSCGASNGFGPFDYRTKLTTVNMVNQNHFTPEVEALIRGKTGPIMGDLNFTLDAFPNHHRALAALARYSEREQSRRPGSQNIPVDCYFGRALQLFPDDAIVAMLYADHLGKTQREDKALALLEYAKAAAPDNPLTQYNVGLLYFQLGRYKDALAQAHRTTAMGMQRTDLMEKLKAKGQWSDPLPAASDTPAPPASKPAS